MKAMDLISNFDFGCRIGLLMLINVFLLLNLILSKNMIRCISSNSEIPSRFTLKRDITAMHSIATTWIKSELEKVDSKISFSVECWSSKYKMYLFMGINLSWVNNEYEIMNLPLALQPLHGSHTGANLCDAFVNVVDFRFK